MEEKAVEGLLCKGEIEVDKYNCISCNEEKQARSSFPGKDTRAEELLEIIHTDVCDLIEVESIGGSKYFLILVDDFSRMAFVCWLQ